MEATNNESLLAKAVTQDKSNSELAHHKQFYGLRKDINQLIASIDALTANPSKPKGDKHGQL